MIVYMRTRALDEGVFYESGAIMWRVEQIYTFKINQLHQSPKIHKIYNLQSSDM